MKHLLALALLAAVPRVADAQPAPTADADAAYDEGRRLYDLREWDAAIARFKEAYRLRPEPKSLYNIAQAHRLKGDCRGAASYYRTYKRNFASEPNIPQVDQFIVDMDECARTQSAEPTGTAPDPRPLPAVVPPTTSETVVTPRPTPDVASTVTRDTGAGLRIGGVAIAGVGAGCLIGATFFGLQARTKSAAVQDLVSTGMYDPVLDEEAKGADRTAKILAAVGGAALIGGGVLFLVGHTRRETTSVAVVPRGDGGMIVWTGGL